MAKRTNRDDRLDPLIRDALAWIVRLKSGEATVADAQQLVDWRTKSPAHERAFRDAVKDWNAIGRAIADKQSSSHARSRARKQSRT